MAAKEKKRSDGNASAPATFDVDPVLGCEMKDALVRLKMRLSGGKRRILIHGERGTGKGLLARHGHKAYLDITKKPETVPFVAFNAATATPEMALSELFGHEKGSFTGALGKRTGLIRSAEGGTFFLDELDKLERGPQFYLLHFLEDNIIRPVGSDKAEPVEDLLVIAAARDIEKVPDEIRDRFEAEIGLKPLRDRAHYLMDAASHYEGLPEAMGWYSDIRDITAERLQGTQVAYLYKNLVEALMGGYWPGNVRQLLRFLNALVAATDPYTEIPDECMPDDFAELSEAVKEGEPKEPDEAVKWRYKRNRLGSIYKHVDALFYADALNILSRASMPFPALPYLQPVLREGEHAPKAKCDDDPKPREMWEWYVAVDGLKTFVPESLRIYHERAGRGLVNLDMIVSEWKESRIDRWRRSPYLRKLLPEPEAPEPKPLPWNLHELQTLRIRQAVEEFGRTEKQDAVARRLGIDPSTLRKKMKDYDIPSPWSGQKRNR